MTSGQKANTGDIECLVRASQAGDRNAFDELVRLYQRRAMQAAVRILGDANQASEAVQVGFVKAYVSIGKLKEPKRFEAWLLRIVTNAAISQARRAQRRTKRIKIADYYADKKTLSPAERQSADELKEAIRQAMSKLSKKKPRRSHFSG